MDIQLFLHSLILAVFMGLLITAAIGDLLIYRIPNAYSVAILLLYPLFALSAPQHVALVASLGVMAAVFACCFVAFAMGVIGGGDAKLMSVVALFAGPGLIFEYLLVTALTGGVLALILALSPLRLGLAVVLERRGYRTLRNTVLTDVIPYGVAIAAGGIYLTLRLAAAAHDVTLGELG